MIRARTFLVGSNEAFLDGLVDWVTREEQLEVVGRAQSGLQALDRIDALQVDLVLMDVVLPDMSGFELARRIKSRAEAPLVVLLSFHDSHAARLEAWAAGADGFVPKSETTTCLTPLVGELLHRRGREVRKQGSVTSSERVPPTDLSE